jgi:hypothetical protein
MLSGGPRAEVPYSLTGTERGRVQPVSATISAGQRESR